MAIMMENCPPSLPLVISWTHRLFGILNGPSQPHISVGAIKQTTSLLHLTSIQLFSALVVFLSNLFSMKSIDHTTLTSLPPPFFMTIPTTRFTALLAVNYNLRANTFLPTTKRICTRSWIFKMSFRKVRIYARHTTALTTLLQKPCFV
jgi:hypothetical protein